MRRNLHPIYGTLLLAVSIEPQEIGRRIAAAREKKGWTQLAFAAEANVSPSSVQRWEGGRLPPVRELIRIAGVLGVEPGELTAEVAVSDETLLAKLDQVLERMDRLEQLVREDRPRARRAAPKARRGSG